MAVDFESYVLAMIAPCGCVKYALVVDPKFEYSDDMFSGWGEMLAKGYRLKEMEEVRMGRCVKCDPSMAQTELALSHPDNGGQE